MKIPKLNVEAVRGRRQDINKQMAVGDAANPRLAAEKAQLNMQLKEARPMPNKGVEAMPRVGPNTGGGLRPQPTGDGRTAPMGDGRTNPNLPGGMAGVIPWPNGPMGGGPAPINGSDEVAKALALIAAHGGQGSGMVPGQAPQNKFDFNAFSEPHAGAVRPVAPGSYMPPPPQAAPIASGGMSPMQNPQHWGMPQFQGMTPYRSQTRSPGIGMDGRPLKY